MSDLRPQDQRLASPRELGFRMPAEWAEHEATWLCWPHSKDWPGKLEAVRWAFSSMIEKLTRFERVRLLVNDARMQARAKKTLVDAGVDLTSVDFFIAPTDRSWARDSLPLFVTRGEEAEPTSRRSCAEPGLGAVKWRFNGWARYPDHELDDRAGSRVAQKSTPWRWEPRYQRAGRSRRVVLEGGSIDVDGEGTALTTRRCLLGSPFTRNPGLDQQGVERLLGDYLGVDAVVWLEDGIAGDDTSGHIDDFARFVAPGTVVVACETNQADENYRPLAAAREMLSGSRDARGRRLQVVELPMPRPMVFRKERLPASYANFYIANQQVLVPTFDDEADRTALGILAELFPSRHVVGVHALDLVVGLGTLHCSTQQEPRP